MQGGYNGLFLRRMSSIYPRVIVNFPISRILEFPTPPARAPRATTPVLGPRPRPHPRTGGRSAEAHQKKPQASPQSRTPPVREIKFFFFLNQLLPLEIFRESLEKRSQFKV